MSKYIYKVDDPSELTAEQKDTISSITTLAGMAIGASTGEVTDVVNAGETAKVAVEDNGYQDMKMIFPNENFEDPNYAKEQLEAIKRIPDNIAAVHSYYNDMTIISFSAGLVGYTFVINNKNGNMWATGVERRNKNGQIYYSPIPEVGINLNLKSLADAVTLSNGKVTRPVGMSASINFGSIVGGRMKEGQIDDVIAGSSVGVQACHGGCIGGIYTKSKDKIVTYGLGTSQIGISGGKMVKVDEENEQKVLRLLGIK